MERPKRTPKPANERAKDNLFAVSFTQYSLPNIVKGTPLFAIPERLEESNQSITEFAARCSAEAAASEKHVPTETDPNYARQWRKFSNEPNARATWAWEIVDSMGIGGIDADEFREIFVKRLAECERSFSVSEVPVWLWVAVPKMGGVTVLHGRRYHRDITVGDVFLLRCVVSTREKLESLMCHPNIDRRRSFAVSCERQISDFLKSSFGEKLENSGLCSVPYTWAATTKPVFPQQRIDGAVGYHNPPRCRNSGPSLGWQSCVAKRGHSLEYLETESVANMHAGYPTLRCRVCDLFSFSTKTHIKNWGSSLFGDSRSFSEVIVRHVEAQKPCVCDSSSRCEALWHRHENDGRAFYRNHKQTMEDIRR